MPRRVLIVDDEPLSVEGPKLELQRRGIEAELAHTIAATRRLLAKVPYDALLLDLMLPLEEMSEPKADPPRARHGLDLFASIRDGEFEGRGGTGRDVPVFVITALGAEAQDVLDECRRRFAPTDVLLKPLRSVLLAETVRLALEEHDA